MTWWNGEQSKSNEGTWGWLILRYLTDEHSAIWDTRPSTRHNYRKILTKVSEAIGELPIDDTCFASMIEWKRNMERNGRSQHYIKQWFTHFGLVVSHGIKIGVTHCREIKAIRSEMRIKTPPRRTVFATRADIEAIVGNADEIGQKWLSLAILLRFEFILRGVDVYGEWSPTEDRQGGITHNGKMWSGGLTWEMFDRDLTHFEKVISKTASSLPEAYRFDLTNVPTLRERLVEARKSAGPVIAMSDGTPPKDGVVSKAFKKHVRGLGLNLALRISDTRSGGITEAKTMVDPYSLRDAAQHTQISTTDIYARGRSESANKVVQMRQVKK